MVRLSPSPDVSYSLGWPRLLKRAQAADYVGVSIDTFDRICPVAPVDLGIRGFRWDRSKLDAWIDALPEKDAGTAPPVRGDGIAIPTIDIDAETRRKKSLERLKCQKTSR